MNISATAKMEFTETNPGADPRSSVTLPARYYYDRDIFARELEDVFYKAWIYVGHESELEQLGSYLTTRIYDQNVFLIRGRDKRIRAFYNVCTHRGHMLLTGRGRKAVISCPYHAWTFELDGNLRGGPGTSELADFDPNEYQLREVRVDSMLGFLFINLDDDALTLKEYFPGLEEEIGEHVVGLNALVLKEDSEGLALPGEVACNWKLLVENFQECYHCETAHEALCTLFDVRNYETTIHHNWTSATVGHTGNWQNKAYTISPEDSQKVGRFWFLWPNLSFTSIPGTPNVSLYRIDPVSPEVAANWTQAFRLPYEESEQDKERSHWGAHVAGPEDKALCESVQLGMHQRAFKQGRLVFLDNNPQLCGGENGVHWHSTRLLTALG